MIVREPEPEIRMSISSLQSLIQKYGANFGIKPQTASAGDGKGSQTAPGSASTSAPADAKPAEGKTPAPKLDSLDLSPAARDYLAAHKGSLGQFEIPNMMDYFFGAQDGADGASGGTGSSLADFLGNPDPSRSGDDPFASLSGFL